MGFLDSSIDRCFRDEKAGRVVVFPGDKAYLVRSEADEPKIRSFIKMFVVGQISILLLGQFLASEWSRDIYNVLGKPAAHIARTMGISLGMYFVVMMLPYLLLWRSYKKALHSFVSPQDQVSISGRQAVPTRVILIAVALIAVGILFLFAATSYVRPK